MFFKSMRRSSGVFCSIVAAFLLAACATAPRPVAPPADPQPYTRINRAETNRVQLQMAMRRFVPVGKRGPVLWLVGASHIGDREYYQSLQEHLDRNTMVLFEGINTGTHPRHAGIAVTNVAASPNSDAAKPSAAAQSGLQSTLAESLGLKFQLDGIDYDRTNFLNSDLSVDEIQALMSADDQGEKSSESGAASQSFQSLLQLMDGSSFMGGLLRFVLRVIGANAKAQAITKLAFIEILGRLEGDLAGMRGMPPDMQKLMQVLIAARNQHVLADFQREAKKLRRSDSVAIFYGAGHMDDLEKRITRELHYRPAGEVWLTAFSVDLKAAGLTASDVQMVQNLIQWQMGQMKK